MPGKNGVDVTKKIRHLYDENTIIIIVSAYDLSEVEEEAREAGANMFIPKPLFQSTVYNVLMTLSGGKYTKLTANQATYDFTGRRICRFVKHLGQSRGIKTPRESTNGGGAWGSDWNGGNALLAEPQSP